MSRYRRVYTLDYVGKGVMRHYLPSDATREPPKIRRGRKSEPGTTFGPTHEIDPTVCIIKTCHREPAEGESMCARHCRVFRHYCQSCGRELRTDAVWEENQDSYCMGCWRKMPEGKYR